MEENTQKINKLNNQEFEGLGIIEIISKIWTNRKKIFIACGIGAVAGLIIGFSIPKTYKAKVSFAPETQQSVGSGVSSIASMMGVSLDNNIDAISVDMFPDVIYSTPFVFELFDLQVETKDGLKTDLLDYMKNHQKKAWWSHVLGAPFEALEWILKSDKSEEPEAELELRNLPRKERMIIRDFPEIVSVEINKKTGKTVVSVIMQDPKVAATVLDEIVENLKEYMIAYRTSKDSQDVRNLEIICNQRKQEYYEAQHAYANFADGNKNLVSLRAQADQLKLQQEMQLAYQVYSQVATQLEGARIKEQQSKPVLVIIEPVTVPLKKYAPSKAKLLIIFTILAGLCSSAWFAFGKEFWKQLKSKV